MYNILIGFFFVVFSCISYSEQAVKPKIENNLMSIEYSNENESALTGSIPKREKNYPTYIVRTKSQIVGEKVHCDVVIDKIRELFTEMIDDPDMFKFNIFVGCVFDPKTHRATQLNISSYFDPISDDAMEFLDAYIPKMNETMLWGSYPLQIEISKGLVAGFDIIAGTKEGPEDPIIVMLKMDSGSHYFQNNYDMQEDFVSDSKLRFRSHEPAVVLSFINRWFFYGEPNTSDFYKGILQRSNYVLIKVHRQFLMDKEPLIFSPKNSMNYAHQCFNEPSKFCL